MVRDADSRFNYRERRAVDEWIESGAPFHVMRDHPNHGKAIMGCSFGGARGVVTGTQEAIDAWENKRDYGADESFLEHHFWSQVKDRALIHDAYTTRYGGNVRPFPAARECWRFVGERCYHDEHWNHGDRLAVMEADKHPTPPPATVAPGVLAESSKAKQFSVLIGCYGPHFEYSARAVQSVLQCADRSSFDVLVGCWACEVRTVSLMRQLLDEGSIDLLIESPGNINKDPMMRLLLDRVTTPYFVWMDDDSHVLPGWDEALDRFIEARHMGFECAGHVYYSHRSQEYLECLHRRPWWVGADHYMEPGHKEIVWFATGGLFLARTEFLRLHNFPDRGMIKKQDDLLLGDLISQHKGRLISFPDEVMKLVRISDGDRCGSGEGNDGWLHGDPP